jgi:AraC-like DNA-binding protein
MPLRHHPDQHLPVLHLVNVRMFCTVLQSLGHPTAPILEAAGIRASDLTQHRALSLENTVRLLKAAQARTRQNNLGLEYASRFDLTLFGPVGVAVSTAPTIREALRCWALYAPIYNRLTTYDLLEDAWGGRLRLRERAGMVMSGGITRFCLDAALPVQVRVLESLGANTTELEIGVPRPTPDWCQDYGRHFRGRLLLEQPHAEIRIPRAILDQGCVAADQLTHEAAWRDCERLLQAQVEGDITHRVRASLCVLGLEKASLERVAEALAMTPRTLARQLAGAGTTYQTVVDGHRKELALWWLEHSDRTLQAIALELGFSETSNFSRTFRRWFGHTPSAMRNMLRMAEGVA